MSYESFKSVSLKEWENNVTRLNQTNMGELRNAVQANADALMDANGNGVISDVRQLNAGLFGNSAVYEVGAEKKLESLNSFIFGEDYRAYTTSNGEKSLVIPTCVTRLFQSSNSKLDETSAIVVGSAIWGINNVNLDANGTSEVIPLAGHTGALAHLSISKTCSELNKQHLSEIEKVYQPNKILFKNSDSNIESKNNSLYISSSGGACVQFSTTSDAVAIKITRDGIIHTASKDFPSIGSQNSRFGTVYAEALDLSDYATVGTTLTVGGKTSLKDELSVLGGAVFSKTLDVTQTANLKSAVKVGGTLKVSGTSTFQNKVTVESNGLEITGKTTLNNELEVLGNTNLKQGLTVEGNTEIKKSLSVEGATTLNNTIAESLDVKTQGDKDISVVIKSTLDAEVEARKTADSEMIGNDTDNITDLTLHGLSNAIEHYAVTWQVM